MRLYLELAKKSFQRQIAYRTATLAGLVTNMFFGLLRGAVMVALYGGPAWLAFVSPFVCAVVFAIGVRFWW